MTEVLITGAGGLLGFYHASALLECGCSVVITDISENSLNKTEILFLFGASILPFDIPYASKESLLIDDSNFLAGTPT